VEDAGGARERTEGGSVGVESLLGEAGSLRSAGSRLRFAAIAALAVLSTGCGFIMAGTWEDDPKNWERAFHSTKPEEVVVVHSKYWRSPHWTYECAYSFEIDPTPEVKEKIFAQNKMRRLSAEAAAEARTRLGPKPPEWFAPKDTGRYEVWVYDDLPRSEFKMFVDTENGHIFWNDYQL
jgi:hypothetical protein